jgi:MFS superfamily sulfate permease-like transporter
MSPSSRRSSSCTTDTDPPPTVVLLDLELTPEIDVPVVEALEQLHQRLDTDGIELWLCHLLPAAHDLLDRAGVLAVIRPERIHPRVLDGIIAFALRSPSGEGRVAAVADVLALIRERAAQPGLSADAAELLNVLQERLSLELSAATGEVDGPPVDGTS